MVFSLINKETLQSFNETYDILMDTIRGKYDYRDIYIGRYSFTLINSTWEWDGNPGDTLYSVGEITCFAGYENDSRRNVQKIEYKIGIQYADYDSEQDDGRCGDDLVYYTEGYLHPTVDLSGKLSYPEFELCGGRFEGNIGNDSVHIKYSWNDKWGGWNREIEGIMLKD